MAWQAAWRAFSAIDGVAEKDRGHFMENIKNRDEIPVQDDDNLRRAAMLTAF